MKIYVTFGSAHYHEIDGVVYDRDCVAEIEAPDVATGREIAFEAFGPRFCTTYTEKTIKREFFRRGIIPLKIKNRERKKV